MSAPIEAPVGSQHPSTSAQPSPSELKPIRELPSLRTANSDTYLQPDGSRLLKISLHPINYRVGGAWQPIDDRLAQGADGSSHPAASPTPISFPSSLSSGAVTIGSTGRQLSFSLQGASAGGTAAGAKQTYLGAMPGVDVAYVASPQSVRETLTLASASAPTTYRYELSLSAGLKASLSPSGDLAVRDTSGKLVYWLAAPTVSDSSAKPHLPWTAPVHYELSSDGTVLSLVLDKSWLESPARVFPVKVDPDVYFVPTQDCSIASNAYAGTSLCGDPLYVGADSETPKDVARSLIQFDLSSIPRASAILSSNLSLWFEEHTGASPIEVEAHGLTKGFNHEATWDSAEGGAPWTTPGGDYLKASAGQTTVSAGSTGTWINWGFTPQVEQWVRDPTSNHGILLKAHDESATGFDAFVQSDTGEEGAPEPNLNVVYEPQLGTPGNQATYQQGIGNGGVLSVNVANGNLHIASPDVRYNGEGYATELTREYNSLDDELTSTSFGPGWRLSMGEDELLYPASWDGSNVFHQPDGSYARFDRAPWADGHPSAGDKAFTGEAYVPATLLVHENGTRSLTYDNTGIEWQFDNSGNGFPQKLVDPGGEGNTISLTYTSSHLTKVTDTHEHSLTLTRAPSTAYVTKIKGASEEWKYEYDSSHHLISYKGPEGQEAKYGYTGGSEEVLHYITDPTGTIVISYDEDWRVSALRKIVNGTISAPGSEDEVTSFTYGIESTVVKHPDGSEDTYNYDEFGNALEEPATQEAASEFYASYAGIEAGAAKADVALQDHASIVDSQLSTQLGPNYTGEWFDPSTGHIIIGITSEGFEQTAEQDLDNLGLSDNTDIVTSSASTTALSEAAEALDTTLASLLEAGLVVVRVRAEGDAVAIEKASSLTSTQNAEVTAAVESLTVPTQVTTSAATTLAVTPYACSSGECSRPLRGSMRITPEGGAFRGCSSGFIARSIYDNKPYVLTAGHCLDGEGGHGYLASDYEAGVLKEEGPGGERGPHKIGTAHSFVYGSENSVPGGTTAKGDAGLVGIEPSGFWSKPLEPIVVVYAGSETTYNERYVILGTHYTPSAVESPQEFIVCGGGINGEGGGDTPEEECGAVVGREPKTEYKATGYLPKMVVHNLNVVNICDKHRNSTVMGEGTSGGPWVKNHRAFGVESGGGGCFEEYEGINDAESALHVHVIRAGG